MNAIDKLVKCDVKDCDENAIFICDCSICSLESYKDEKFNSCKKHILEVTEKHFRIRGRIPQWMVLI